MKNQILESFNKMQSVYSPINPRDIPAEAESDPMDLVTMDVPLLIRLFELMHEKVTDDAELHQITTQILNVSKANDGPLTMAQYNEILNGSTDSSVDEGIGDFGGGRVSAKEQSARLGVMAINESVSLFEALVDGERLKYPNDVTAINETIKTIKDYRKIIFKIRDTGSY